jgi:hypothetical protein
MLAILSVNVGGDVRVASELMVCDTPDRLKTLPPVLVSCVILCTVFVAELMCSYNCFTVVESSLTEFNTIFVELCSTCSSSSVFTVLFGIFETSSVCGCLVVLCRILEDRLSVVVLVGGIQKN